VTYRSASTQLRFGYLTPAASFHWNLLKLLGDITPFYHLAPLAADDNSTLVSLPYLNSSLTLCVKADGVSPDDWLERASATLLAEVHADCMASLLCVESADVATTLLSNVGHTVVIRVVLTALRMAHACMHRQGQGPTQTSGSAHHHDCTHASRRSAWRLIGRVAAGGDDRASSPLCPHQRRTVQSLLARLNRRLESQRPIEWLQRLASECGQRRLMLVGSSEFLLVVGADISLDIGGGEFATIGSF